MNQDQLHGKWEQLKGAAKHSWGNLTDDDFTKAEGSAEKLYGIIHEKFGDAKETIKARLTPQQSNPNAAEVKPDDQTKEPSGDVRETHMMRGALRALFAVGVVMVVLRLTRRASRRSK